MTGVSRLFVPVERLRGRSRLAPALLRRQPKIVLRRHIALGRRELEPEQSLLVVLRDALTGEIEIAEQRLRGGIAVFREGTPDLQRLGVVAVAIGGKAVLDRPGRGGAGQTDGGKRENVAETTHDAA